MFVASAQNGKYKEDIMHLKKDGACITPYGKLVLSFDETVDVQKFAQRYAYLVEHRLKWMEEGKRDLIQFYQNSPDQNPQQRMQAEYAQMQLEKYWHNIYLRIDENIDDQKLKQLIDFLAKQNSVLQPNIQVVSKTDRFSTRRVELLIELDKVAKAKGWGQPKLNITNLSNDYESRQSWNIEMENSNAWNIGTLARANVEIDQVVEKIKKAKLSPVEAVQYINLYVSRLVPYTHSKNKTYRTESSYLGAFAEKPELVCAGFSDLVIQIVEKLNMPGLTCRPIFTKRYTENKKLLQKMMEERNITSRTKIDFEIPYKEGYHEQVEFVIEDEKYQYYGNTLADVTHNNRSMQECPSFAFSMLPMDALVNYRNTIVRVAQQDRKGIAVEQLMSKESRVGGYIEPEQMDIVANARRGDFDQVKCEKSIFEMYKRVFPQATLEELYQVMEYTVQECCQLQNETFYDEGVIFFSPYVQVKKEWMKEKFEALEKEQKQRTSATPVVDKPKQQRDIVQELEEILKKKKPKPTDGIGEIGDGMDDR